MEELEKRMEELEKRIEELERKANRGKVNKPGAAYKPAPTPKVIKKMPGGRI
jgi:BMFP domain-containing protein YqiC